MLVLSRQKDESIIIGEDIVVTIVDIRGDKVRLGVMAPTEVSVHRREVYEAIQRENQSVYKQFGAYLENGNFTAAHTLYSGSQSIANLVSEDQRLMLEQGLGKKLQ